MSSHEGRQDEHISLLPEPNYLPPHDSGWKLAHTAEGFCNRMSICCRISKFVAPPIRVNQDNYFYVVLAEPFSVTRSTTTEAKEVAKSKEKVLCQILSPSPGSNQPSHQFSAKLAQLYLTFLYI